MFKLCNHISCSIAGCKFTANSKGMRIIERNGTSLSLESQSAIDQHLSADTKEILEYVQEVRQKPLTLVDWSIFNSLVVKKNKTYLVNCYVLHCFYRLQNNYESCTAR